MFQFIEFSYFFFQVRYLIFNQNRPWISSWKGDICTLTNHEVVYIAADATGAGRSKLGESPVGTNALQAGGERRETELLLMAEIRRSPVDMIRYPRYPIIFRVLYIPGGCLSFLNHQQ